MKHKSNKAVITILSILTFILLAAGLFYGTYYLIMNKSSDSYESSIKTIVDKVNEVNSGVSSVFKGQALDANKARSEMSGKIDALSKQKQALEGLAATDKYKADHENLIKGLDNNILMFRQVDAIAKNPNGKDLDKAGQDLKKYKDQALENYSLVNIKNAKVGLTDNGLKLVDYTSNFVFEMVKLNRDKEITQKQNLEFINSLDGLISRFSPINQNLSMEMSKERGVNGNKDNVIALADKNRDVLASIKQEFSVLTVPSKAVNCYKLFKKVLEDFDDYLVSFDYSAKNEKLLGSNITAEKLNEIYSETDSKYNEIVKGYSDFLKAYSEFRESTSK